MNEASCFFWNQVIEVSSVRSNTPSGRLPGGSLRASRRVRNMPEEDEEPEAVGEEGEGEDGGPKPPALPIPGAEDQFEQLNDLVRNEQVAHV